MKRKNLFVGLLLVLMTFNTLHAFVIDALDTHVPQQVSHTPI